MKFFVTLIIIFISAGILCYLIGADPLNKTFDALYCWFGSWELVIGTRLFVFSNIWWQHNIHEEGSWELTAYCILFPLLYVICPSEFILSYLHY